MTDTSLAQPVAAGALVRFFDGDVWHSFKNSPVAIIAAVIALVCIVSAMCANWLAPHNPLDLATLELMDARLPPAWMPEGSRKYLLGTIHVATAIITEATLSFLGVGMPPTSPSLGTLIRVGNDYLFSGEWWITIFPGVVLIMIALSVNLLGDWLRDALNPRLR